MKGQFTVNEQSFDLEKGRAFLVKMSEGKLFAKQLAIPEIDSIPCKGIDWSQEGNAQDKAILAIGEKYPEISRFISGTTESEE